MGKTEPTTSPKYAGYENIFVDCPLCARELVLNRASDLHTFKPIFGTHVSCEKCYRGFWLNGDSVNERHESLIFDCRDLLARKRYMNCILNICQAYEMFFRLYLRVRLLYVPFGSNSDRGAASLVRLNQLSRDLECKIERFAFKKMRSSFLRLITEKNPPGTLDEAAKYIMQFSGGRRSREVDLQSTTGKNLEDRLVQLAGTKIDDLRNDVVPQGGPPPDAY